jgi:cyclic pyranopterin phosphate synthase
MDELSHLDAEGRARMVDVGQKPQTRRRAVASALVRMAPATLQTLQGGRLPKGDALAVARIAGIQGAKLTPTLVPLCHPLPLDHVAVLLRPEGDGIRVLVQTRTEARTGVEMEALTGAAAAALALIDMVKGVDRGAWIAEVRVECKEGGKSGRWVREGFRDPWDETPPEPDSR